MFPHPFPCGMRVGLIQKKHKTRSPKKQAAARKRKKKPISVDRILFLRSLAIWQENIKEKDSKTENENAHRGRKEKKRRPPKTNRPIQKNAHRRLLHPWPNHHKRRWRFPKEKFLSSAHRLVYSFFFSHKRASRTPRGAHKKRRQNGRGGLRDRLESAGRNGRWYRVARRR